MPRIDRVRIHNFRGASSPLTMSFAKQKPLVVIFGENGTGKTTIVDALDAVGNGSGGSLTTKSSTTLRAHLPTVGKKPGEMLLEVSAGAETWTAKLGASGIVTTPTPRPPIRVLRRINLQRFIDSPPGKRYEELKHLIGVERVERSEDALKRALDAAKQGFDDAVRARGTAEEQLAQIWHDEGSPGADWRSWAREAAAADHARLSERVDRSRRTRGAIADALRAGADRDEAETTLRERHRAVAAVEAEVAASPALETEGAVRLADLLRQVRDHLHAGHHAEACPVCGQAVRLVDLQRTVDDRLADLARFEALSSRRRAAQRQLDAAEGAATTTQDRLIDAADRLWRIAAEAPDGFAPLAIPADARAAYIGGIRSAEGPLPNPSLERGGGASADGVVWDRGASIPGNGVRQRPSPERGGGVGEGAVLPTTALSRAAALVAACEPLVAALQAAEDAAVAERGRANTLRAVAAQAEESLAATIELERIVGGLAAAHEAARRARLEFTQRILDEVAEECNRLYEAIHPDEGLAVTKIELDDKKRASLNQHMTFEGHAGVAPQAYLSEAHLDTFGFCFWLAFAKREHPDGEAVLVLDDVFSSVDAPHQTRILDLIVAERCHFAQIIIATHQRSWRDAFRNAHGPGNLTDLIELQGWSLAQGIFSYQTPLALDELRNVLRTAPFNRQVAASSAGILLEATLDRLTFLYRSKVPRTRDNAYTLQELLDATSKLFQKLEVTKPPPNGAANPGDPAARPCDLVEQLRQCVFVRNQVGAHHNVAGMAVSDAEVRAFATLTGRLVAALTCPTCGQIPSKSTGTHFRCSCSDEGAMLMAPLVLV